MKKYFIALSLRAFYLSGLLIDLAFVPLAILLNSLGYWFYEVKTHSFGHHLIEPVAVLFLAQRIKRRKRIIFLASRQKARVPVANELLKQLGQIVEHYTLFDPRYWLARNGWCGPRRDGRNEQSLAPLYQVMKESLDQLPSVCCLSLIDSSVTSYLSEHNLHERKIIFWKPRIVYQPQITTVRYSSSDSVISLLRYLHAQGFAIVSLTNPVHHGYFDFTLELSDVKNINLRQKLSLIIDQLAYISICGQSGGSAVQQLLHRPLIMYDLAYPYSLNLHSTRALMHMKDVFYKSTSLRVSLKELLYTSPTQLNNLDLYEYIPLSDKAAFELFNEMERKIHKYPEGFPPSSYIVNSLIKHDSIMTNIYNIDTYCQLADCVATSQIYT